VAVALLAVSACASGPSLQSAISLHNQYKHALEGVDTQWTPVRLNAAARASELAGDNDKAYQDANAPFDHINELINHARQFEQIMQLAISQWQIHADDGGMLREVAPCGVEAMNELGDALLAIPTVGPALYPLSKVLARELSELAPGGECKRPAVAAEVVK
jgi:hypothetical protein